MTDAALLALSKGCFGFAICVIIYIVYYEWKKSKIAAEEAERKLGEEENENRVNSLTPDELIALVNADTEPGSAKGGPSGKKST